MSTPPRFTSAGRWAIRLGVLVLVVLGIGIFLQRSRPPSAYAGMPAEQRAYWEWVGALGEAPADGVSSGLALLEQHPDLSALYLRLVDLCLEAETVAMCRDALQATVPPDDRTRLYRDAALTLLLDEDAEVAARWQTIAADPALDPTLARLVVDRGRADAEAGWLTAVEEAWQTRHAADTTDAGTAFGLGYAAVLRSEWDAAEPLLQRAARLAPNDPQAFRELGRIYYVTGQPDAFQATLERGIAAAEAGYDLEQALILRGNLGLAVLQWKGDVERAGTLFEEALAQSRLLADRPTEGFNLYRLANVRARQHRYREALMLLDSAEVRYADYMPRRRAEVLVQRGKTLTDMYRFSEAEEVLTSGIAEADSNGNVGARIEGLIALVQLRYQMGEHGAARTAGLQALDLATQYRATDFAIAARKVLGDVERLWGDFEGAEVHYQEGLSLAESTGNHARMRELYERLGLRALDVQDINAAQAYFEQMLEQIREDETSTGLAVAYLGLGRTYYHFQNYAEAERLFDLAIEAVPAESEGGLRAKILRDKAAALLLQGEAAEATTLLREARRLVDGDRNGEYRVEVALGNVFLEQGQYDEALRHFRNAEAREDQLQWSAMHWEALYGKALAYWRLGQTSEAERAFRDAVAVIETLRESFAAPEDRSFFVQNKIDVYENFSGFLEAQGRSKEAFHYNERARSRSLVDLLYTTQQGGALDEADPAARAVEMNRRLRALDEELAAADEPAVDDGAAAYRGNRAAYLRRERRRADSLYRQVELDLYGANQIYTFNPLEADSVQALLHDGEVLVVYNLRQLFDGPEQRDASVVYVVQQDTVLVRTLDVTPGELTETVRFFRDQISGADGGPGRGWEPTARKLYDLLLAPVAGILPPSTRHLHIVPEGILHYLPFAALQRPDGSFLVEDYTLSVVPSATILRLCRGRNPSRWSYMLLLADPDGRLPGARNEVRSIAASAENRRHLLVGDEATQETFEDVVSNYDVIHFATHGNFVSWAPWRSYLELHDDVLSVEEIGRLRMDAYLVTLSACETALSGGLVSDVPNGDEWVGLNQAFLAAGTPTVMASLWAIDDRASSSFMVGFYDRLGAAGKAHALAEMQRRFLQDERTRHPFYWAAFTVIGDPL